MTIDSTGVASADRGPYQQLYSGKPFYLLDPKPEDIDIKDIAWSLSNIRRYNGHSLKPYTVAQHSVMVATLVAPHIAFEALFHDAEEAYGGDMTRPVKLALEEIAPRVVETLFWPIRRAISVKFNLGLNSSYVRGEIKKADNIVLATERRDLMADTGETDWGPLPDPLPTRIIPLDSRAAFELFMGTFDTLSRGRAK
jgi:hypothetical protein